MSRTQKNYDPACLVLADHFAQDLPVEHRARIADELAQSIQNHIEMHLEYETGDCLVCNKPRLEGDHAECKVVEIGT